MELRLWGALGLWLRRALRRPARDEAEFGYHRRSPLGALVWMALFTAPVELLAWELLIPWAWLRLALLIGSLYGLLWIAGFAASLRVLPHRIDPDGLRLRYGLFADGAIPYDAIEGVALERHQPPERRDGLRFSPRRTIAYLAVGGRTDVTLTLRTPRAVRGPFKAPSPVRMICLAADEPERLACELARCADLVPPDPIVPAASSARVAEVAGG